MSFISPAINRLFSAFGYAPAEQQVAPGSSLTSREIGYSIRDKLLDNSVYLPRIRGGSLETILRFDLGLARHDCGKTPIIGAFNPVREIIDLYSNIWPGAWGDGMTVAPKFDGRDVHPSLLDDKGSSGNPLAALWRWSGLDVEKQKILTWSANLGTVGLRIYRKDDPDPAQRRVYLQVDHPKRIVDYKEDDRGNVTEVYLRYDVLDPDRKVSDGRANMIRVEEVLTKESFSRTYGGIEQLEESQQVNELGVCPYVILRHQDSGDPWGLWAYYGSEVLIHQINYLFALLSKSVSKSVFPKWFATAGGEPPKNMDLGEDSVAYVKSVPDTPPPSFEPLVPPINYDGIMVVIERMVKNLRSRQPEMNLNNTDIIANLSGEALQQFLKPVAKKVLDARPNYDSALSRALRIGLSEMVSMGITNFGTGEGPAAANAAYAQGLMDFSFGDRPALPLSSFEMTQQAQVSTADQSAKADLATKLQNVVSNQEQLRLAGYTDEQITTITAERAKAAKAAAQNAPAAPGSNGNKLADRLKQRTAVVAGNGG